MENLVIVESPAKAKTIEKFLGKDFIVKSSFGHIRDLSKKKLGVDIENNFEPNYEIPSDKKSVVADLRKEVKKASIVWLASDEDREGEAIAWHLSEVLKLNESNSKRIVFHEITKKAILDAVKKPRAIDQNVVDAQQARRILDRLVGFELSPVLWRKIKSALSAGRVQSVAVRLIVERERDIIAFESKSAFRVIAQFIFTDKNGKEQLIRSDLNKKFKTKEEVKEFLQKCINSDFTVASVQKKPSTKTPAAPFTTSTLQQEASRKLGFSVSQTMVVAQKLYEAGKITYMRTDSKNLSETALTDAREAIIENFGSEYHQEHKYITKTKGAQEAHEAIRPTYLNRQTVSGSAQEVKLYDLIWKRTIASQMSNAKLEKTVVNIAISNTDELFVANGEVIIFDGFLKVYIESTDDESESKDKGLLPPIKTNDKLNLDNITATERFTHHPPRYTEASLVKKLEELGIGRPSTYAPTISTIQNREYVVKESHEGTKRNYVSISLKNNKISERKKTEITGADKNKLFPTDIGMVVTDFLVKNFTNILDYNFTAKVEKDFDGIAQGKSKWKDVINTFYFPFHDAVENTIKTSERSTGQRLLGDDPATGKPIYVRIGRFGPMAQLGENSEDEKPKYAGLRKGQHIESITLEEAIDLFKLPRTVGDFEDKTVVIGIGRFGPYVRHNQKFVSLKKDVDDPMTIDIERAIELILEKREADAKKLIKVFDEEPELTILDGRWGPYIKYKGDNYKIPKKQEADKLTFEECMKLVEVGKTTNTKKTGTKGRTSKFTKTKKTTTKKK